MLLLGQAQCILTVERPNPRKEVYPLPVLAKDLGAAHRNEQQIRLGRKSVSSSSAVHLRIMLSICLSAVSSVVAIARRSLTQYVRIITASLAT
jgi:hypothetical protein